MFINVYIGRPAGQTDVQLQRGWRFVRDGAGAGLEANVVVLLPVPAGHGALHAGAVGADCVQFHAGFHRGDGPVHRICLHASAHHGDTALL